MGILKEEKIKEEKYLKNVINVINNKIFDMSQNMFQREEKAIEFKKYIWDNRSVLDPKEMRQVMVQSNMEIYFLDSKAKYFRNLCKVQKKPYFGSFIFKDENNKIEEIYLGITYLEDDNDNHLIYDWRSPISSLFYDYEIGKCIYIAPGGKINGELIQKRQYKIENGKIVHIFDNNLNIDDDLLQEVLANDSNEKMKNIVNTIQQEQNAIIRNTTNKNLIVQGIAGSGKTSVALHRIAFLLYKIENLNSNNVLIFSPNQVFTEYISQVLPELGEDNTMQTTFHDFLLKNITEYSKIESFTDFIGRYYQYKEKQPELVKYKQSNEIIEHLENYVENIINNFKFIRDIEEGKVNYYTKEELNADFHNRYSRFCLIERLKEMSNKYSENNYRGSRRVAKTYFRLFKESINFKIDYKQIFLEFFKSKYCKFELSDDEIKSFINKKVINYEDAILFVYLKGLLQGFPYNNVIKEVVIDEAQDYTKLQYKIISKIFKSSGFTILGDINQTINPYYRYDSLYKLADLFIGSTRYLELLKTYRSSAEIIEYANKILGLDHVSAIRKANENPVIKRKEENLKEQILKDIKNLEKKYSSIAVITKDEKESMELYDLLKESKISLINSQSEFLKKDLVILPSYLAKGLEFDAVIVYNKSNNKYKDNEQYLYYVAVTRAQHELIIYN